MADVLYRTGQALRALTAFLRPIDRDAAAAVLGPDLMPLFDRMRRSEQLHSIAVMKTLREAGHTHPDLMIAALLHDCGKSRYPYGFTDRVLVVVVSKVTPARYRAWGDGPAEGARRRYAVARQHPVWSAEDMAAHGASTLAVALARRHQTPLVGSPQNDEDRLLAALQWADDTN